MTIPLFSDDDLVLSADDLTVNPSRRHEPNATLPGLDGAVTILRDAHGIPHVRAGTAHDAFFGQGFATAQDRLWHMDHDRRMAYGRWAEVVGDSAVEQDTLMRRLAIGPSVEVDIGAINAETRGMLEAYAAGVNAFIETTRELPVEFRIARRVAGAVESPGLPRGVQGPTYPDGRLRGQAVEGESHQRARRRKGRGDHPGLPHGPPAHYASRQPPTRAVIGMHWRSLRPAPRTLAGSRTQREGATTGP